MSVAEDRAPSALERPGPLPESADVVILGAGAAGLWAAGTAAARGKKVLLLEKNPRVGVKILASGGTHCNVTTTLEGHALSEAFGRDGGRFLRPSLRRLGPRDVRNELDALGVPTEEGEWEKVWPKSRRASDVAHALLRRALAAGATVRTGAAVLDLRPGFVVRTSRGDVTAPKIIVTVGGRSYPKSGTTGDGYAWLQSLGHTIVRPTPALVPLVIDLPWVRALAGITVPQARVWVDRKADRRRPLLFTHTGLSGPGAMDVSRWFELGPADLHVDFLPDVSEEELRTAIAQSKRIAKALPLPARLAEALCEAEGVRGQQPGGETSRAHRHALLMAVKRWTPPVSGTRGFDHAEVTAGGVALPEVDPSTMESRIAKGLFVAGEILDVDGPIGGFNFQSAFSTGHAAGLAV
ncbi:MAG TPA: NAD(P)/FAD-dependent oxidoreductase [Planctomycetota bacterium]|nr:NAD(P)/FAD-dependent oxidoreductase [Planctomycetota bacterium]